MEENELNKKYQYGWYGTCENECEPLYFNQFSDRDKIESVIRVSVSDGRSFEKFTAYDESSLSWVNNLPNDESFDDYICYLLLLFSQDNNPTTILLGSV